MRLFVLILFLWYTVVVIVAISEVTKMGKRLSDDEGMEAVAEGKAILTQCIECGKAFYQETRGTYAKYCSHICKQKAYDRRFREEAGRKKEEQNLTSKK